MNQNYTHCHPLSCKPLFFFHYSVSVGEIWYTCYNFVYLKEMLKVQLERTNVIGEILIKLSKGHATKSDDKTMNTIMTNNDNIDSIIPPHLKLDKYHQFGLYSLHH